MRGQIKRLPSDEILQSYIYIYPEVPVVQREGLKSENRDGSGQACDSLRSGAGRVDRSVTDRLKSSTMHGNSHIRSICSCVLFKGDYDFSAMKWQTTGFPKGVSIGTVHRSRDMTSVLRFGMMF